MEHARNFLKGHVESFKIMLNHKMKHHDIEAALTYKMEKVEEKSKEYEMRDSSGYSIPHTPDRLDMIYSLNSTNEINSHRLEGYIQDAFKFSSGTDNATYYTLNYGVRFSHWAFNRETVVSKTLAGHHSCLQQRYHIQTGHRTLLSDTILQGTKRHYNSKRSDYCYTQQQN